MIGLRVCIDVPDLERGVAFYRDGLGLAVARRRGADWVELSGAPVPIDLLPREAGTAAVAVNASAAARSYERHWTPVHLDLVVDDLDAALARALAAGARLEGAVAEQAWGRMANLADPFGHGLCLLEFRGRGYDELADPA